MIRSFRLVIFAALVLLVAGVAAFAQGPGGVRGRGPGGLGGPGIGVPLQALNLTEAQRKQVQQVTEQHREQTRTLIERLRTAQIARRQAVETLPVDESRIRAAMQDLAAIEADLAVEQAQLRSQLFSLLTPEQQAEAQKLRAAWESRMRERQLRIRRGQGAGRG
jgi:protein CpxP